MNRYEKIIRDTPWAQEEIRYAFASSSAETRQASPQDLTPHTKVIWDTAANVIGPLYTAFVWWILQNAREQKIERLYFMARDGHILKEIADILAPRIGSDIEKRYLHVSRESLLFPSIIDLDNFDHRWILWPFFTPLKLEKLLNRARLDPDEAKDILNEFGLRLKNNALSWSEKFRFKKFLQHPKIKEIIKSRAHESFLSTFEYLRQEGMGDGKRFAVVDLGWLALSQYSLSRILDKGGIRSENGVTGYYLGTNPLIRLYKNDRAFSFMFDPSNFYRKISLVQYELPEIFATVTQGRTLGYHQSSGRIEPILGQVPDQVKEWGCEIQRKGILTFAENVRERLTTDRWTNNQPTANISDIFRQFCNDPSLEEAAAYGKFIHGADMEGKDAHPISKENISLREILSGYYWVQGCGKKITPIHRSALNLLANTTNLFKHILLKTFTKLTFGKV